MIQTENHALQAAGRSLTAQSHEYREALERRRHAVYPIRRSGTGHIDETFASASPRRLVYVRCHFDAGSGTAPLTLDLQSAAGIAHNTRLATVALAGNGNDVNFRVPADELRPPSAWTLAPGDALKLVWTNPDPANTTWGIEVGLAPAP